ncbi:unnamed protein product [Lathyrus oleraceus]
MERLEPNQVELKEDTDAVKGKVDQMLEAFLSISNNDIQHVITENIGPTSDFTMVTNPKYDLPPDYAPSQVDVPI